MKFLWFLLIPSKLRGKIPTNWNVRTVIMTNDRLVILCNIQFCRWSIKNTTTTKINLLGFSIKQPSKKKETTVGYLNWMIFTSTSPFSFSSIIDP